MTLEVVNVHSPVHYSVRLIEHIVDGENRIPWPSKFVKLAFMMANHFKNPDIP